MERLTDVREAPDAFYEVLGAILPEADPEVPRDGPPEPTRNGHTNSHPSANGRPDALERAGLYLDECQPAISGKKGHNQAFKAACNGGPGFGLDPEKFFVLMRDRYNPRCEPPWSEKELRHKVEDAYKRETRRGWLLDADRPKVGTNGKAMGATKDDQGGVAIRTKEKKTPEKLANFTAIITKEITRHEAGEACKEFEITATRDDGVVATVVVKAADYSAMKWVKVKLGSGWIIEPGRDIPDLIRFNIDNASLDKTTFEQIDTSLGWIETEDGPLYLHAGGAIRASGSSDAVRVEVPSALSQYLLPDPPRGEALKEALESRFRIAELGKVGRMGAEAVAAIMETMPCRAVLGPLNFTPHFDGTSGSLKTSAAIVVQGSFGLVPIRGQETTTTSWASTLYALQALGHACKDSLLVIDELTTDDAVRKSEEFFQAQGNLKQRDRMTAKLAIAPTLDPRGSVLSTGENAPRRNSAKGRGLMVPVTANTIDLEVLSKIQEDVAKGLHRSATAAFVRWLATDRRIDRERAALPARADEIAKEIGALPEAEGVHPRTPRAIAELLAGYEVWLRFARSEGEMSEVLAKAHYDNVRSGLLSLLDGQRKSNEESKPSARFLALLRAALTSGRYHLKHVDEVSEPDPYAGACGWKQEWTRSDRPDGDDEKTWKIPNASTSIGYIDPEKDEIYLNPELAKKVAREMGQSSGQPFDNPESLARELDAAGLLRITIEAGKRRLKIRKRIGNTNQRYLTLKIGVVFETERERDPQVMQP